MLYRVKLSRNVIWYFSWSLDLVWSEFEVKTLGIIFLAYKSYSGPVRLFSILSYYHPSASWSGARSESSVLETLNYEWMVDGYLVWKESCDRIFDGNEQILWEQIRRFARRSLLKSCVIANFTVSNRFLTFLLFSPPRGMGPPWRHLTGQSRRGINRWWKWTW